MEWPTETVLTPEQAPPWYEEASNRVLDFHGDPLRAKLVVFSDGNHHMALGEAVNAFYRNYPEVRDIFYATTAPAPIITLLTEEGHPLGKSCPHHSAPYFHQPSRGHGPSHVGRPGHVPSTAGTKPGQCGVVISN